MAESGRKDVKARYIDAVSAHMQAVNTWAIGPTPENLARMIETQTTLNAITLEFFGGLIFKK